MIDILTKLREKVQRDKDKEQEKIYNDLLKLYQERAKQ